MSNGRMQMNVRLDGVPIDPKLGPLAAYAENASIGGSNSQRAYDIILGAILNRVIPSGQRLAEIPVARAIASSRTPVREALLRLEADGFVKSEPRLGMVVAGNTLESFAEIYEVREVLEGLAARLAARYARSTDIAAMEKIIAESLAPSESHDTAQLRSLNSRFHETIHSCARNNQLQQTLKHLVNRLRLSPISAYDASGRAMHAIEEHRAIVQAIAAHDEERAAELTSAHIRRDREERLVQMAIVDLRR